MVSAKEYINGNYKDKAIKELDISNKELEGELDLSEFTNLKELNFSNNKITDLKLARPSKLRYIDGRHNELVDLNNIITSLNPEKLEKLKFSDNNFHGKNLDDFIDLSAFSEFTNLRLL